jgi:transcriptional regulator with XRE-family HTH domain
VGSENEPSELSRRLRQLRKEQWQGVEVRQKTLTEALGVAASSVSNWEKSEQARIPTPATINKYATFFATKRSIEGPRARVLDDAELTADERAERDRLKAELHRLRTNRPADSRISGDTSSSFWHFPDGGPIRIVCGELLGEDRPKYADPTKNNYMQLSAYADLDALIDLYGHVRAVNPIADIRYKLATELTPDDLQAHLVLLGGLTTKKKSGTAADVATNPNYIAKQADLLIRQVVDETVVDGEVFELDNDPSRRFTPKFDDTTSPRRLIEDVGLLARTRNPTNKSRTLTICSGVFTRGVYAAVRCLTDPALAHRNSDYLLSRFGSVKTFGLLIRVPTLGQTTGTRDLSDAESRLYEWTSL